MMKFRYRAPRTAAALAVAVGSVLLGACNAKDELLSPQQPAHQPGKRREPRPPDALYVGALGRWKNAMNGNGNNTEAIWNWQALFTDEMQSSDTFSQRQRRRSAQPANERRRSHARSINNAQQARGFARTAINALLAYDTSPAGKQHVGEMYMVMGYVEMELSEVFCNGIPFGETIDGVPTVHATAHRRRRLQARHRAPRYRAHVPHSIPTTPAFTTLSRRRRTGEERGARGRAGRRWIWRLRRRSRHRRSGPDLLPVQLRLLADLVRQRVVGHGAEREALLGG